MIESESESDEKEKWLNSNFKTLLYCVLGSVFDNIMITLNNRKLNDSEFHDAVTT